MKKCHKQCSLAIELWTELHSTLICKNNFSTPDLELLPLSSEEKMDNRLMHMLFLLANTQGASGNGLGGDSFPTLPC